MKKMRSILSILSLAAALLVVAPPNAAQAAAWSCSSGYVCVWSGTGGTGSRCTWSDADPDWLSGSIQCGWTAAYAVRSAWNRGTSTSYRGVEFYTYSNYVNPDLLLGQGIKYDGLNDFYRSHRWVS